MPATRTSLIRRLPKSRLPSTPVEKKVGKRVYHAPDEAALLWPRQHSCRVLSCSMATIIRLEEAGKLDKIKLDPTSPNGMTYHRPAQVRALAGEC